MPSLPNPIRYHVLTNGTPLPDPVPYDYVLAQGGVYKRADCRHFYAAARVAAGRVAGLAKFHTCVLPKVPPIPVYWLQRVLEHARLATVGEARPGHVSRMAEAMYHFHYLPTDEQIRHFHRSDGWRVAVPRQVGSGANVTYVGGDAPSVALDLHSHHEMPAFFSTTDDSDEQGCRFYAVIGRIYSRPEIRLRVGIYGDFADVPAEVLFGDLGVFRDAYQQK